LAGSLQRSPGRLPTEGKAPPHTHAPSANIAEEIVSKVLRRFVRDVKAYKTTSYQTLRVGASAAVATWRRMCTIQAEPQHPPLSTISALDESFKYVRALYKTMDKNFQL